MTTSTLTLAGIEFAALCGTEGNPYRHWRMSTSVQHDGDLITQSGPNTTMTIELVRVTERGAVLRMLTKGTYSTRKPDVLWRVVRSDNRNLTGLYPTRKVALAAIGA
jgi:hypothetical protein